MKSVSVKVKGKECQIIQFETLQEAQAIFSKNEIISKLNFAYKIQMINVLNRVEKGLKK